MPGNYSMPNRPDGTVLSSAIYMADHTLHITNLTPDGNDDFQATLSQKQVQTNPSAGLATALSGDLAQLRYVLAQLAGTNFWFEAGGIPTVLQLVDKAVATVATKKDGVLVPRAGIITKVLAYSDVQPTGADLIFDLKKNGTSIWNTTPTNRVKVLAGQNSGVQTNFDVTALAEGDRLDLDIAQIGSGVAGGNWSRVAVQIKPNAP